ncbi:MAG: HNH endonuclease [Thermoleophilia bacterium]|nr:HNH endonuclease [Thermoleophilia bacterium]
MTRRLPKQPERRIARLRSELYALQGGLCHYCQRAMTLRTFAIQEPRLADSDATVEHLVPRVLGGRDVPENLVAACHACNRVGARIDRWAAEAFPR